MSDTAEVRFETSIDGEMPNRNSGPIAYPAKLNEHQRRPFNKRSELNVAVCDSDLEWRIAEILDSDAMRDVVTAYARNLCLGWTIPYLDATGNWRRYVPDFVVRLTDCPQTGRKRHIVLEGKGFNDPSWPAKRDTTLSYWLPGVNASADDACAGRWQLLEVRPDNQLAKRIAEPYLVCTVGALATTLQQLTEKDDVWN